MCEDLVLESGFYFISMNCPLLSSLFALLDELFPGEILELLGCWVGFIVSGVFCVWIDFSVLGIGHWRFWWMSTLCCLLKLDFEFFRHG